jgi:hypothetical protein
VNVGQFNGNGNGTSFGIKGAPTMLNLKVFGTPGRDNQSGILSPLVPASPNTSTNTSKGAFGFGSPQKTAHVNGNGAGNAIGLHGASGSPLKYDITKSTLQDSISRADPLRLDKGKGKAPFDGEEADGIGADLSIDASHKFDYTTAKAAADQLRRKTALRIAKESFKTWVRRVQDRVEYREVVGRSEAYARKTVSGSAMGGSVLGSRRSSVTSTASAMTTGMTGMGPGNMSISSVGRRWKRKRPNVEYRAPETDEQIAERLREVRRLLFHDKTT